jgi:hypothetical protein
MLIEAGSTSCCEHDGCSPNGLDHPFGVVQHTDPNAAAGASQAKFFGGHEIDYETILKNFNFLVLRNAIDENTHYGEPGSIVRVYDSTTAMPTLLRQVQIAAAVRARKLDAMILQPAYAVGPLLHDLRYGVRMTEPGTRHQSIRMVLADGIFRRHDSSNATLRLKARRICQASFAQDLDAMTLIGQAQRGAQTRDTAAYDEN